MYLLAFTSSRVKYQTRAWSNCSQATRKTFPPSINLLLIYLLFNIFQRNPGRPVVRGRVRQIPFLFKRDASPLY